MAAALNGLSKFDEALRAAEHASRLSPNFWQANYEMAKSYLGKADYQRALDQLAHAQQQLGREYPPLYLLRAHIFIVLKNYDGAAGELKSFLRIAPSDPNASAVRDTLQRIGALMASSSPVAAANAAPR